jgi:hypothetical protein
MSLLLQFAKQRLPHANVPDEGRPPVSRTTVLKTIRMFFNTTGVCGIALGILRVE